MIRASRGILAVFTDPETGETRHCDVEAWSESGEALVPVHEGRLTVAADLPGFERIEWDEPKPNRTGPLRFRLKDGTVRP